MPSGRRNGGSNGGAEGVWLRERAHFSSLHRSASLAEALNSTARQWRAPAHLRARLCAFLASLTASFAAVDRSPARTILSAARRVSVAAAVASSHPGKRSPRGGDLAGTHACIIPVSLPTRSFVWFSSSAIERGGGGVGRRISRPRAAALSWSIRAQQKPSAGTEGAVVGMKQACGVWSEPGQSSTECVARSGAEAHVWSIVDGRWWDRPRGHRY